MESYVLMFSELNKSNSLIPVSTAFANNLLAPDTSTAPCLIPIARPDAIITPKTIITFEGELMPMFCLI